MLPVMGWFMGCFLVVFLVVGMVETAGPHSAEEELTNAAKVRGKVSDGGRGGSGWVEGGGEWG